VELNVKVPAVMFTAFALKVPETFITPVLNAALAYQLAPLLIFIVPLLVMMELLVNVPEAIVSVADALLVSVFNKFIEELILTTPPVLLFKT
jgi:hypothetical protein